MHPELCPLHRIEDFERLLSESAERPLLIFKHSYTCGISAEALDELVAHLSRSAPGAAPVAKPPRYAMVTVQSHREVSNAVSKMLGIRHETPQALLIRDRRVIWSASHFRVTASAVESALNTMTDAGR